MAAEFEHVNFCTVMHVLQRLENWRSSSENTTGDDLIHCLCARESFERSLEVAVMSYSENQSNRNSRYNCKFLDRTAVLTHYVVANLLCNLADSPFCR